MVRSCGTTRRTFDVFRRHTQKYILPSLLLIVDNILVSWIPESLLPASQSEYYVKVELSDLDTQATSTAYSTKADILVPPPPQGGLYAFSIPLSQVYSLLVRPPRIGWWSGSLVVNARGGETFPALFFHDAECKSTQLQQKKRSSLKVLSNRLQVSQSHLIHSEPMAIPSGEATKSSVG
jgi:hypothetical protein